MTLAEIKEEIGGDYAKSTFLYHLEKMENCGIIRKEPGMYLRYYIPKKLKPGVLDLIETTEKLHEDVEEHKEFWEKIRREEIESDIKSAMRILKRHGLSEDEILDLYRKTSES